MVLLKFWGVLVVFFFNLGGHQSQKTDPLEPEENIGEISAIPL